MRSLSAALERIVAAVVRRPLPVLAVVALLGLGGGVLALGLTTTAGTDTLVDSDTSTFQGTERYQRAFGGDAVLVLVREDLDRLLLTADQGRLGRLEGCIAGNIPPGVSAPGGPDGPCAELARDKPVSMVYGPATFINESANQIAAGFAARQREQQAREKRAMTAARGLAKARGFSPAASERLAREAQTLVRAEFLRTTLRMALNYGIRSVPRPDDATFVSRLVFDRGRGGATPKARFAYILPNRRSALIQARLRPDLTDAERNRAIALVREVVRLPAFRLRWKGTYTVTGAPVLVADVTSAISRSILVLLIGVVLVMALTLTLVFRSRQRLLPLALALAAAGVLFGGMALVGASLTMASIAVLPILIGLGVDYMIQLQARFDEVSREQALTPARAAPRAAALAGPVVATACGATAAGFLVLGISPVPMVRGFGLLLVVGVGLAFACAITAGFAALSLARGGQAPPRLVAAARRLQAAGVGARTIAVDSARGAGRMLPGALHRAERRAQSAGAAVRRHTTNLWRRALAQAFVRPARVLGIAIALALVGFVADTQTRVVSDITRLVPSDLPAVRDLETLQRTTGVAGQIDVMVSARDLADPRVLRWMSSYQSSLLRRFGYRDVSNERVNGCGQATLCPALSLTNLFQPASTVSRERTAALLDSVPPYFAQAVFNRRQNLATMSFGIRLMPLDRQQEVIEEMRSRLRSAPPGVSAQLVGLPVLAAQANAQVSSDWRRLASVVLSLLAVALVLLAVYRRPGRALVPLVPIALAGGWSALVLFAMRIPLNPMSVTLGALVIAISTEFSVLLAERYRQERQAGSDPATALAITYASTGRAVMASGITAIAGFAVLMLSGIRMLRDFGAVTVVDLSVSLLGVMIVLPAVLVLDERGELVTLPARALARMRAALRRLRARAPAPAPAPAPASSRPAAPAPAPAAPAPAAPAPPAPAPAAHGGMTAGDARDKPPPAPGPLSFDPDDPDEQARRWAHRQDPDLQAARGGEGPPAPPRPRSPYGWLIALVAGALLIYISINNLGNVGSVPRGSGTGQARCRRSPPRWPAVAWTATPTWPPPTGRASAASARRARCAARRSSTPASSARARRWCWPSWPPASPPARLSSTASSAPRPPSRGFASRRWRRAPTAPACAARSPVAAGACRSGSTPTGRCSPVTAWSIARR